MNTLHHLCQRPDPDSFPKTKVVADVGVRFYRFWGLLVHGVNLSGRIGLRADSNANLVLP
jgi:hypothetical protein